MITMITGGTRSGKSGYAQQRALQISDRPAYLATARQWDEDFSQRIQRHQADRDLRWINWEEELYPSKIDPGSIVCVLDCCTLWLTNIFMDKEHNIDASLAHFKAELDQLSAKPTGYFIVTNELGLGMHAETALGRQFADLQGWANQYLASLATEVVMMVSGLPLKLK